MKIKKRYLAILLLGVTLTGVQAQTYFEKEGPKDDPKFIITKPPMDSAAKLAATITAEDMRKHLTVLASDEYEGRETGEEGNKMAAEYIANHFKSIGLPPVGEDNSYFQKVSFTWTMWNEISITVEDKNYRHLWDFISFPTLNNHLGVMSTEEVVFLGYGIDDPKYSDYEGVDVKDKVILIYKDEPVDFDGNSYITGDESRSPWSEDYKKKLQVAKEKGVKVLLFIENELQKQLSENRRFLIGPKLTLGSDMDDPEQFANHCFVSTKLAKEIMGKKFKKVVKLRDKIKKSGKPQNYILKTEITLNQDKHQKTLKGENVLGYIEGSDPEKKDEVVIITAHYDHLGKRGDDIYNGADDNGSGTTTVMEIAEAFAQAKKQGIGPRRSLLVMTVTGEEKGLLGSQFYVEFPVFPLENTVANVNVDMVGRVDEKYQDNPEYIYVIGSDRLSTELHEINENANKNYTQLTLDYTYNAEDDPNRYYYRSDHYNFAERGIPAVFYFNGTHPDYHRTSDTVEKINFDKMAKVGQLIFHTAWDLANRDKRIEVDVFQE